LNAASIGVVEAAMQVAGNTFSEKPLLPLDEEGPPAPASVEGRRRLGGAFAIAVDRIQPDPNQPRRWFDTKAQKELNDSVRRLGILQPITVRFVETENIYQIITGQRRYHAARETGLADIPCWVQSPKEEKVLLHQIVENWQRLDMHPYDLADALARLRDANGYTQRDLARETGKSEGEISKLLALLNLDPAVQKVAREDQTGRITRRHLYAVRELPAKEQLALIHKAQQDAITATEMEAIVANKTEAPTDRKRQGSPVSHHRFPTSHAMVSITFCKKDVTREDILTALDEARLQVCPRASDGTMAD
jgi:ParB family transcriptional regulator, chromosome partitioning protein